MQKVLIMYTVGEKLRSEAQGWGAEDGDEAAPHVGSNRPVGLMGYFRGWYQYPTPYHALGDGWKLLAPPTKTTGEVVEWEWWFVKD